MQLSFRIVMFAVALIGVVGCDTKKDTIEAEPYFSAKYSMPKEKLVSCITSELILLSGTTYNMATRPSDNVTQISVTLVGYDVLSILTISDNEVVGRKNPWVMGTIHNSIQKTVLACATG